MKLYLSFFPLLIGVLIAQPKELPASPDEDGKFPKMLEVARTHNHDKQPAAAIEECDKVISAFEQYYAKSEHKVNCARSSTEGLAVVGWAMS